MNNDINPADETLLPGYGAMARFLTERGLKTSRSTLCKLGAPSINAQLPADERFPIEGYWGVLPIAKPSRLLSWAWRRLRPSRSEPPQPSIAAELVPAAQPAAPTSSPSR